MKSYAGEFAFERAAEKTPKKKEKQKNELGRRASSREEKDALAFAAVDASINCDE